MSREGRREKGAAAVLDRTPEIQRHFPLARNIPPFKRLPAQPQASMSFVNLKRIV